MLVPQLLNCLDISFTVTLLELALSTVIEDTLSKPQSSKQLVMEGAISSPLLLEIGQIYNSFMQSPISIYKVSC